VVRELSHALYGFLNEKEKEIFEVLMNISGVGPKLALSLIGHLSLEQMQAAVTKPDLPTLCKVPGVGKKTAERLVVELKDKLSTFTGIDPSQLSISLGDSPETKQIQDAMSALINLGYHQSSAQKAVKQSIKDLPEKSDLAQLITTALKHLQLLGKN
jgi:Holliday junction DNA helicase RuvA